MKRLGALEALGRGLANLRGNLELVGVQAGGSLTVLAVVVLTLIPLFGLGGEELDSLYALVSGHASPGDLAVVLRRTWTALSDLWALVLALSIGLTAGSVVWSWVVGGVLGVLVAGDAQAPPGSGREGLLFRTWSWRLFVGEATRLVWRVLLYYSLWLLVLLVLMTLLGGLFVAAAMVGASGGTAAGFAVGCGGALPLIFLFFAASGAMTLGQVELVRPASAVRVAMRAGLRLLGRRLPAAIGLFVLFFTAALALGLVEGGVGFGVGLALAGRPVASGIAQGLLFVVQLMLSSYLNLALLASFVALVRSERIEEPEATA